MHFRNVLVLAPHTDDGELGCGGFIAKLIRNRATVTYVAFSTAEESVPVGLPKDILKVEVQKATNVLGIDPKNLIIFNYRVRHLNYHRQEILEQLIKIRNNNFYDLVLLPSPNDIHQDHTTIAQEGIRAFKNTSIFGYELMWNNLTFNTQCFVKLDPEDLDIKIRALKEYSSQGFRDYLSKEFIFSLAHARGVQIGCKYAEAYEVIRLFY